MRKNIYLSPSCAASLSEPSVPLTLRRHTRSDISNFRGFKRRVINIGNIHREMVGDSTCGCCTVTGALKLRKASPTHTSLHRHYIDFIISLKISSLPRPMFNDSSLFIAFIGCSPLEPSAPPFFFRLSTSSVGRSRNRQEEEDGQARAPSRFSYSTLSTRFRQ